MLLFQKFQQIYPFYYSMSCAIYGGWWIFFTVFKIIPKSLRDTIYEWIAKNRYRWFGKKESCMLPTPELKARFLG